jgi:hypothetical protein
MDTQKREFRRCCPVEDLCQVSSWFPNVLNAPSASETVTGSVLKGRRAIQTFSKGSVIFWREFRSRA